jgi:hypothetical protein
MAGNGINGMDDSPAGDHKDMPGPLLAQELHYKIRKFHIVLLMVKKVIAMAP